MDLTRTATVRAALAEAGVKRAESLLKNIKAGEAVVLPDGTVFVEQLHACRDGAVATHLSRPLGGTLSAQP